MYYARFAFTEELVYSLDIYADVYINDFGMIIRYH